MKQLLAAIALVGLIGCVPQLPDVPEIPSVEIPEVEVPTTPPFPIAPGTAPQSRPAPSDAPAFDIDWSSNTVRSTCIAGFVETSDGVGTIDIYIQSEWSPEIQSIPGVSTASIPELELEAC